MREKPKYGYCALTADGLHIGHINFINSCADKCQILLIGVMSDECVKKYKGKYPVMNQEQRMALVGSIKRVLHVTHQDTFEFPKPIVNCKDTIIFDSEEHKRKGAKLIIKRTKGISSSRLKDEGFNTSQL